MVREQVTLIHRGRRSRLACSPARRVPRWSILVAECRSLTRGGAGCPGLVRPRGFGDGTLGAWEWQNDGRCRSRA